MTALPAPDADTLTLVCDGCGHAVKDIASRPSNWPVVWALVSKHGWHGSPLMFGPHYCPRCCAPAPRPSDNDAAGGRAGTLSWYQHAGVVRLAGNLDIRLAAELGDMLADALRRHHNLVLDLGAVRTADSIVLGLLLRARRSAREHGGRVCLVAPSGVVADVLHTTRLATAFEIFPSTEEALAWLATGTGRSAPPPHRPGGRT